MHAPHGCGPDTCTHYSTRCTLHTAHCTLQIVHAAHSLQRIFVLSFTKFTSVLLQGGGFRAGRISWENFVFKGGGEIFPCEIWGLSQCGVCEAVEALGFAMMAKFSHSENFPGEILAAQN